MLTISAYRGIEMQKQLTWRALVIGLAGLLVITASSMYVALRMGALPWPTIFVTVVSMAALKHCKNSTIQEINCTHTIMSAGAMVAGGLAFTLPGLWMLDPNATISVTSMIALTAVGVILGTIFTSILRKRMIEEEALPYPMGTAACETLKAGMAGGRDAAVLFLALLAAALYTALRDAAGVLPQVFVLFAGSASLAPLMVYNSPMALGIGVIIGPVLAGVWLLGMIIGHYVLVPVGLATGLFADFAAATAFRTNLGIGLMIGTGIGVLVKAVFDLVKKFQSSQGSKRMEVGGRRLVAALLAMLACLVILVLFTDVTFVQGIILIIGVFLTTYLSSMLTGQTGINPMEIFGMLVLLIVNLFFKNGLTASFTIAAVTAVACGLAGDVMNDLKSGYLLKADPQQQIVGEAIGGIVGAVVSVFALLAMKAAFGTFGTAELPAPQAAAVSAMVGGLQDPRAFAIGCAIGLVLFLAKVPTATLGLGVYLDTPISAVVGLGAIVAFVLQKTVGKKYGNDVLSKHVGLVSSGMLGGEGVTGVIIALISMLH